MEGLFEAKEYIRKFYTKYSRYINMIVRFLLALLTFLFIGEYVGFMQALTHPAVVIGVSIICVFLPLQMTTIIAVAFTLVHLWSLAPGIAIVMAIVFLILFAFYFRFAPRQSAVLLLTPLAFMFHVPIWIPVVTGLVGGAVCVIPVTFGIMIYYMLSYVESYATMLETVAEAGMMGQISTFTQQVFANKEMWMIILSFTICLLLVYNIRRLSVDYAWMIASVAGILANLIMMTFGHVLMDIPVLYGELAVASVSALVVSFFVYIFQFSVDYSRTEYLQFEDDKHYYYVKAVPKVSVSMRERTVKKIHVRKETESIDVEAVKGHTQEVKIPAKSEDSEIQRMIEEALNK